MPASFMFPPAGFGPGSQPSEEDGRDLGYMPMPSGMRVFEPHVPYLEDTTDAQGAARLLRAMADVAMHWTEGEAVPRFDPAVLDARGRAILADTLGEGEVALVLDGAERLAAQESVFAGVWRVARGGVETIEIGAVPAFVTEPRRLAPPPPVMRERQAGVENAPAVLTEIFAHREARGSGAGKHVVNLTLLPHTREDLAFLDLVLGRGPVSALSRGYGNCRVEQTAYADVWRVRYFNSQDTLILDTIEVTGVPDVIRAAPEDVADSAARLREVAEALS